MKKHLLEMVPLQRANVQWRQFGADAILVDPASGEYAQINETGVLIWKTVDGKSTVRDIVARLAHEFSVGPGDLEEDVASFVEELALKQLLTMQT